MYTNMDKKAITYPYLSANLFSYSVLVKEAPGECYSSQPNLGQIT